MKTIKFVVYKASLTDVSNGHNLVENEEVVGIVVKEFSQLPGQPYYGGNPVGGFPRHNPNIPGGVPQYNPNLPYPQYNPNVPGGVVSQANPNIPVGTQQYYNPNVAGGLVPQYNPNARINPNAPGGTPQYYSPSVAGGLAPHYDPKNPAAYDPNNPQYNQLDPNNPQYNPNVDPNNPQYNPQYNPNNPNNPQYSPNNPNNPQQYNPYLDPSNPQYDPNYNPNDPAYASSHRPSEVDIRLFIDGFPLLKCVSQGTNGGQYQIINVFGGGETIGRRHVRSREEVLPSGEVVTEPDITKSSLETSDTAPSVEPTTTSRHRSSK